MGTILRPYDNWGSCTLSRIEAAGDGGFPSPGVHIVPLYHFCIFWGRDTPCIIVEVGAGKWGGGSNDHLGPGNLFIGSIGQKTGGRDGVVAPC